MKTLTVIYFKPNPEHLDEYVERHCHVCTAPVSLWPKCIYGALYFAQTSKLLIEIINTPDIRRSLFTYLKRL